MPNHCQNYTDVAGPTGDLQRLIEQMTNTEGDLLLSNLVPASANEDSTGYTWERENWGNKWGDYDHFLDGQDIIDNGDGTDTLSFGYMTAWSPFSTGFWQKVSRNFPTLRFSTTYEEHGSCYAGAVLAQNGVVFEKYTETLPDYPVGDGDEYLDAYDKWVDEMAVLRDQLADWCAEQMGIRAPKLS